MSEPLLKQLIEDSRWLTKNLWRKNWYEINKIKSLTPTPRNYE